MYAVQLEYALVEAYEHVQVHRNEAEVSEAFLQQEGAWTCPQKGDSQGMASTVSCTLGFLKKLHHPWTGS